MKDEFLMTQFFVTNNRICFSVMYLLMIYVLYLYVMIVEFLYLSRYLFMCLKVSLEDKCF